ncbi:hypothetical protein CC78DRAFT_537449 [Lojkania enalia]|uniref:Ubiquitin 3 binding protein But2 C-terminal domain-containing protein n=1 Tax=Lojkania enalia TaxID=147567 RepID=A0A9P4JYU9_9PLEO|nr:hypothetical protein CC78DRAFT_537449 [Didymosphaeria enalia]
MLLTTLFLLPLLAGASPFSRRACAIEYPSYIGWVDSENPDMVFFPLPNNAVTRVSKEPRTSPPGSRWVDTFIEFKVPQGSWGCQLELYFEKGFGMVWRDHPYGPVKADVWNVDGNVPLGPYNISLTWNSAPKPVNLFGTTGDIPLPAYPGGYSQDVKKVINSAGCKDKMTYRVKVPAEVVEGGVRVQQDNGHPFGGWRMLHNC